MLRQGLRQGLIITLTVALALTPALTPTLTLTLTLTLTPTLTLTLMEAVNAHFSNPKHRRDYTKAFAFLKPLILILDLYIDS